MTFLALKDVTKNYQMGKATVYALRGLDLDVAAGEIVAIMGPSGSGKSTLMHILGALDVPTAGTAYLEQRDLASLKERQLATLRGRRVGFVFQTFNLIPTLNAQQNVELPMIFQGTRKALRARRARELLGKVGLSDRIKHKPSELSGGERQRVAMARALANDPEIVLADEPTGNLDTESGGPILAMLKRLSVEDGKTVILVTHDPEAAAIADRIVRLRDGRVVRRSVDPLTPGLHADGGGPPSHDVTARDEDADSSSSAGTSEGGDADA
jgi:putative ABC transport system ATP-binding protein